MKISIAYEVQADAVARVESLLTDVAMRDCNWGGVEFEIVRDDFTCIPDHSSLDAAALFSRIQRAIDGDEI